MAQAWRASISTPVRSTVSTLASTATKSSPSSKFTDTEPTRSGWHSGIMSDVRLAAWMPATRATDSTSPFLISRLAIAAVVSARMNTLHRATARRWVGSLGVTSTIRARPSGSRWVKERSLIARSLAPAGGLPGTSAADLAHRPSRAHEVDLVDAMSCPLATDGGLDATGQVVVARAGAHRRPQVGLVGGEQARPELPVGREPHPIAVAAEGLGDRRDHADGPTAVAVAPPVGGRGATRRHRLEREHGVDAGDDLVLPDDGGIGPRPSGIERHPLDEADLDALA